MNPKVLLATPIFDEKEYAAKEWLDHARAYTYPHNTLLLDNSVTADFFERLKWQSDPPAGIFVNRLELSPEERCGTPGNPAGSYYRPLTLAAEYIRRYVLAGDYDLWLNVDADEFSAPDLIEYLLDLLGDADVLNHASPNRQLTQYIDGGFGCVLFRRRVLQAFSFNECPPDLAHDVWFYRMIDALNASLVEKVGLGYVVKRTRGTRLLEHWDGLGTERITGFSPSQPYLWKGTE